MMHLFATYVCNLAIFAVLLITNGEVLIQDNERQFHPIEKYSNEFTWYAPFYSGGGYSSEAIAFVKALDSANVQNFTISQHGDSWNPTFIDGQDENEKKLLAKYDILLKRPGYPRISICHSEPGAWYTPNPIYHTSRCPNTYPHGQPKLKYYKIGRTMFETDRLPSGWIPRLNYMDEIWVPTEHMKKIFLSHQFPSRKIHVVAEAVDTDFFKPMTKRPVHYEKYNLAGLRRLPANLFIFLFVGKFEARKGIDILLKAYFNEFKKPKDEVLLIFLTGAYHSSSDFESQIKQMLTDMKIPKSPYNPGYMILSAVKGESMPVLYSFADVVVIPSHGEGWGRPHMEAMACGTPIIATNWSGPTAFINDSNGYLIDIEKSLVDAPGWKGHKWAQPKVPHLQQLMRHVYENQDELQQKGRMARRVMVEKYSLPVIGAQLIEQFNRVSRLLDGIDSSASVDPTEQEL
jgi:glycosyltransferase involved in cell wall biosynthesis